MTTTIKEHSPVLMGVGVSPHPHHWVIEEAHGSVSLGKCHCGETRLFHNWDRSHDYVTSTEARIGC